MDFLGDLAKKASSSSRSPAATSVATLALGFESFYNPPQSGTRSFSELKPPWRCWFFDFLLAETSYDVKLLDTQGPPLVSESKKSVGTLLQDNWFQAPSQSHVKLKLPIGDMHILRGSFLCEGSIKAGCP